MDATVLLYNVAPQKRVALTALCRELALTARVVSPEEQNQPAGAILGFLPKAPAMPETLPGEMLVMAWLEQAQFNALLAGMRKRGISVALKAMLTPTNMLWPAPQLYRELSQEHEAMRRAIAGKGPSAW